MTKIVIMDEKMRGGELGPCMQALNERQRKFVYAMLDTGQANYTACAQAAGYLGDPDVVRQTAHRLAHDEKVQAAIQEEARKRMNAAAIMATGHLVTIAANPAHKDQLSAIKEILNRTGLHAVQEYKVNHTHTVSRQEMVREVAQIAQANGLDPVKLLEAHGVTIDAEYAEVEPEGSLEGLEDLV